MIIFELPLVKKKLKFNRLALIIGSIFPDVTDKILMFLTISSGRGYFHTLLFTIISFLALFLISKRNFAVSSSFLVGMVFHLILDLPDIPIFYPFIPYNFEFTENYYGYWLISLFTDPVIFTTELIGAISLILIIIKYKLYRFKKITSFLIKSNQHLENKSNSLHNN